MESTNKELVTGPCSSIESRTSEEEVSVSQLREVHSDGTQTVELNRRHKGPIGFYIARGSTQFKHGKSAENAFFSSKNCRIIICISIYMDVYLLYNEYLYEAEKTTCMYIWIRATFLLNLNKWNLFWQEPINLLTINSVHVFM